MAKARLLLPWRITAVRYRSTLTQTVEQNTTDNECSWSEAHPFTDIPGPKGWPYIGVRNMYTKGPYSIDKFHLAQLDLFRKYGKIYKQTIAGRTTVHVFDPEMSKVIYQMDGKMPMVPPLQEGTQMYRRHRDMALGLGNINGEDWYRVRSAVQRMMMRPQDITQYMPTVCQVADDFVTHIDKVKDTSGEVPHFETEMLKWNLESSAMTCFATRLNALQAQPGDDIYKMLESNAAIKEHTTTLSFSIPWHHLFKTTVWRKLVQAEDYFSGTTQDLTNKTMEKVRDLVSRGELSEGQYPFMTYLMSRDKISYKDMSTIVLSLFSDGLSTTVPTMIGQLYCLATNQEKQDKLYSEIQNATKGYREGDPLVPSTINKLSYLKAVVKEGFRLFPVAPDVTRIAQDNLVVGGYQIPAGTILYLQSNMLLRLPEFFDKPDEYRPERWLREEMADKIHPYLLLPFSFGPRMCVGRRFAEQEMYVLLIKILQKFKIEWPHEDQMGQRFCLLFVPDKPARFRFTLRA